MNSAEIQYALNRRGYCDITEDSTIDKPVELGHLTGKVVIESSSNNKITVDIPDGQSAFNYTYRSTFVNDPPQITFDNLQILDSSTHPRFFTVVNPSTAPEILEFFDCTIPVSYRYAIDCTSSAAMRHIWIEGCQQQGGGFIRWRFSGPEQVDFITIEANRKQGSGTRVGPTVDLTYPRNLTMLHMTDENSPEIIDEMKSNWAGPIAFRIINPSGFCIIDDYWFEPWGSWNVQAPGCHGFEVRVDDATGNYGHFRMDIGSIEDGAVGFGAGVYPYWVMGGGSSSNAASLAYRHRSKFAIDDVDTLIGGKARFELFQKCSHIVLSSTNWEATLDALDSDLIIQPIYNVNSTVLPKYDDGAGSITYSGSQYETDWQDASVEYDA